MRWLLTCCKTGAWSRHETQDKAHRAAMTRGYKDYIVQEVSE